MLKRLNSLAVRELTVALPSIRGSRWWMDFWRHISWMQSGLVLKKDIMQLLKLKSVLLATLLTASAACFVLAFAAPGQAAARNLSQMEMARLYGGSWYEDVCCEDDYICFASVLTSVACPYRELVNCNTWQQPNYYEILVGVQGRFCSRPMENYEHGMCLLDDETHICLERRYCSANYVDIRCDQDTLMEFPTPNNCADDNTLCYF